MHPPLKIEHLALGNHINQMWGVVQQHVGEKFGLVNLTGICTRRSDPDGNVVFQEVRKIVIRTIPGNGLFLEIPSFVGSQRTVLDKEDIDLVPFFVCEFGELKTSCGQIFC
ncbi:MAG: hypothetical protein WBN03_21430 [Desulfobacterales bacterium]